MVLGKIELTDELSYCYFISCLILSISVFPILIFATISFCRNICQRYIDLLKLLQIFALFTPCLGDFLFIVNMIFDSEENDITNLFKVIATFGNVVALFYLCINQFSLYILSQHLTIYRNVTKNVKFEECRKKIFKTECISFLAMMLVNFCIIVFLMLIIVIRPFNDTDISRITHSCTAAFILALLINEYIIYRKAMTVLRRTLNFYYNKRIKMMRRTMIINIWFLSAVFCFEVFRLIDPVDFQNVSGFYPEIKLEPTYIRVIYLTCLVFSNFPWYFYVYANITKMSFKDWMIDILQGYKKLSCYENCSIFIIKSCCYRVEDEDSFISDLNNVETDSHYISSDINYYDDTDEYMRNYKMHLTENSRSIIHRK